jgi:hypothetical protein
LGAAACPSHLMSIGRDEKKPPEGGVDLTFTYQWPISNRRKD